MTHSRQFTHKLLVTCRPYFGQSPVHHYNYSLVGSLDVNKMATAKSDYWIVTEMVFVAIVKPLEDSSAGSKLSIYAARLSGWNITG